MTQLYVHPMIHDNFVEYDLADIRRSPADRGPADLRRQVMQDYVGEKVILIRNPRIDYDAQFIRQVHFPHNWSFKKFGSSIL